MRIQNVLRLAGSLLFIVALLATPATALADDVACSGPMGAVTVDNLFVPDNATCTLDGTIITGNL